MPLMRDWTEITVEEGLLSQVVRELLALAEDPNHVEVTYGVTGRVILAESSLAERWYQEVNKTPEEHPDTTVQGHGYEVVATEEFDPAKTPAADSELATLPVKRGPGRPRKTIPVPPSASDGEEKS